MDRTSVSGVDAPSGAGTLPDLAHAQNPEGVLSQLAVKADQGLSSQEAAQRLARFGPNKSQEAAPQSIWRVVVHQLRSPVVVLLFAAALLAFFFQEWVEGYAILAVLLLNTLIGFVTEIRAIRSMEALRLLGSKSATVLRDGQLQTVDAGALVPGDIVSMEAGDAVPADIRLIQASGLAVDESALTGESVPVDKMVQAVSADARVEDRSCMVFRGTAVVRGHSTGVVTGTGHSSELGRISDLVATAKSERSPIERGLSKLAGQMVWLTLALTVCLALMGFLRGEDMLLMAKTAIALAVAAIPEGLPIVATLALARGVWRMASKNALVERLSAVETLGATTLILTDKTGTLTENRMHVAKIALPFGVIEASEIGAGDLAANAGLEPLLVAGTLCSSASLGKDESDGVGDPMEIALLRSARQAGMERPDRLRALPQVAMHAFETEKRMMATVHSNGADYLVAVKGAPEAVLSHCTQVLDEAGSVAMDKARRDQWEQRIADLAHDGLRVLALANKRVSAPEAEPYSDLVLLGLVGMVDPARSDVPEAIRLCHSAGVKVVMATGDHGSTASSIGRQVGIHKDGARTIEGHELASMDANGSSMRDARVFARVSPEEKLSLVKAFQQSGEVVAMTGDGVNDAPALRQADIGVAMGIRGTDVAREAAVMVLLDDAFATIPAAIREGRVIFGNIRRFAAYLLSCNLGEVLVVGLAILLALPMPLLPLQILYLNLVTDVFPAFALATGEGDDGVMRRPPRPPGEAILGRPQWLRLTVHGVVLSGATFGAMAIGQVVLGLEGNALLTTTFLTVAFSQLFHVFNMRHPASHPLKNEVVRNPWIWASLGLCTLLLLVPVYVPSLASIFSLVPPTAAMWATILGMSLLALFLLQIAMIWLNRGKAS